MNLLRLTWPRVVRNLMIGSAALVAAGMFFMLDDVQNASSTRFDYAALIAAYFLILRGLAPILYTAAAPSFLGEKRHSNEPGFVAFRYLMIIEGDQKNE